MSDTTVTAAADEAADEAGDEAEEHREQTWRVLKLTSVPSIVGGAWVELGPLTGSGKYGYRPDAIELGERHGDGRYLLVESPAESTFRTAFEVEVASEPNYYDVTKRAELERWRAERDAEASEVAAAELRAGTQ